jgi:hypothetical protein
MPYTEKIVYHSEVDNNHIFCASRGYSISDCDRPLDNR